MSKKQQKKKLNASNFKIEALEPRGGENFYRR